MTVAVKLSLCISIVVVSMFASHSTECLCTEAEDVDSHIKTTGLFPSIGAAAKSYRVVKVDFRLSFLFYPSKCQQEYN